MITLRIFVSSPGDVQEERFVARNVIDRLRHEFRGLADLKEIYWEDLFIGSGASFQAQIPQPSTSADLCVFVLWSRMGTPLSRELTRPDGSRYESGTIFEFEDAVRSYRENGFPDILVYRKTAEPVASIKDAEEALKRASQYQAVEQFIKDWFMEDDGSFKLAFHPFETPFEIEERLEQHIRQWIIGRLEDSGVQSDTKPPWQGSPFRGLQYFDTEHALIFCGRTQAVSDVVAALRTQAADGHPFVLISGMSGSGKSSLVRAGIQPLLTQPHVIEDVADWRWAIIRPGGSGVGPLGSLVDGLMSDRALPRLVQSGTTAQMLKDTLGSNPEAVLPMIGMALDWASDSAQSDDAVKRPGTSRLLLLVDQFEELFTDEAITREERDKFITALASLISGGRVWILATIRSDFYPRLVELPESFAALTKGAGHYELRPPNRSEIGQMIRRPAQMAGLKFERRLDTDEGLDDVLQEAASGSPAALPLLQFALDQLFEKYGDDYFLSFDEYEELGGLEGALGLRADEVFESLSPGAQDALDGVLSALARVSLEDDALSHRREHMDIVAGTAARKELVDAFIDARLFVADRAADGSAVVGVAHEALLNTWHRVKDWLDRNRDFLQARSRITAAAVLWRDADRAPSFLYSDRAALEIAQELRTGRADELSVDEIEFVDASLAEAAKQRKQAFRFQALGVGVALIIVLFSVVYWDLNVREHISYYETFVKRYGIPEGRNPIDRRQVANRAFSFKFVTVGRGKPLARFEVVDSAGNCPNVPYSPMSFVPSMNVLTWFDVSNESWFGGRECVFEYEFQDGALATETARDEWGGVIFTFQYTGRLRGSFYLGEDPRINSARSGASIVSFKRVVGGPNAGIDREIAYMDTNNVPRPNDLGSYGRRVIIGEDGQPVSMIHLDRDGKDLVHKGNSNETGQISALPYNADYSYEAGRMKAIINWVYEKDTSRLRDGVSWIYDDAGNPTEVLHDDGQGRTYSQEGRPHRTVWSYDKSGMIESTEFFDMNGERTRLKGAHQQVKILYDSNKEQETRRYEDAVGNLTMSLEFYARIDEVLTSDGLVQGRAAFDTKGEPTNALGGYYRLVFDRFGNRIEQVRRVHSRAPKTGDYALRREVVEYDGLDFSPDSFSTRTSYFDEADEPLLIDGAYYQKTVNRYVSSEGEIQLQEWYFDQKGQPITHPKGYDMKLERINNFNRTVSIGYLDREFNPVVDSDGVSSVGYRYEDGMLTEEAYYDAEGDRVLSPKGYARIVLSYNDFNQITSRSYRNLDDDLVNGSDGYALREWLYTKDGSYTYTSFDDTRSVVVGPGGFARYQCLSSVDRAAGYPLDAYYDINDQPMKVLALKVAGVDEGSSGDMIGLREGDVLVSFAGNSFTSDCTLNQFANTVSMLEELIVERDGEVLTLPVPPGPIQVTWSPVFAE